MRAAGEVREELLRMLEERYGERVRERWYSDPFHVLVACILSQRTREENTEKASRALLSVAPTPERLSSLPLPRIRRLIRGVGLAGQKARNLKRTARLLLERYGGRVPETREALMELPGVGPKTADVVLCYGLGKPAVPVDTHVNRISKRLGLVREGAGLEEVRETLQRLFPVEKWHLLNRGMVLFGREICLPRHPRCGQCPLRGLPLQGEEVNALHLLLLLGSPFLGLEALLMGLGGGALTSYRRSRGRTLLLILLSGLAISCAALATGEAVGLPGPGHRGPPPALPPPGGEAPLPPAALPPEATPAGGALHRGAGGAREEEVREAPEAYPSRPERRSESSGKSERREPSLPLTPSQRSLSPAGTLPPPYLRHWRRTERASQRCTSLASGVLPSSYSLPEVPHLPPPGPVPHHLLQGPLLGLPLAGRRRGACPPPAPPASHEPPPWPAPSPLSSLLPLPSSSRERRREREQTSKECWATSSALPSGIPLRIHPLLSVPLSSPSPPHQLGELQAPLPPLAAG